MKENTCCFTGHRSSALSWKYEEGGFKFSFFKRKLKKSIKQAIADDYIHFISGMALGVDMIVANLVLELKTKYPDIPLECAIPCLNQATKQIDSSILRYQNIQQEADKVTIVSDSLYYNGCMPKRNKYMVDHSSRIIAVFNGKQGGTAQTIRMAENAGLSVVIIKP